MNFTKGLVISDKVTTKALDCLLFRLTV